MSVPIPVVDDNPNNLKLIRVMLTAEATTCTRPRKRRRLWPC